MKKKKNENEYVPSPAAEVRLACRSRWEAVDVYLNAAYRHLGLPKPGDADGNFARALNGEFTNQLADKRDYDGLRAFISKAEIRQFIRKMWRIDFS